MKKIIESVISMAVVGCCFYGFVYLVGQLYEFVF